MLDGFGRSIILLCGSLLLASSLPGGAAFLSHIVPAKHTVSGTCSSLSHRQALAPFRRSSLSPLSAAADGDEDDVDNFTRARIEELLSKNKIVLFMKGNKLFPSCGFSNTAVSILNNMRVPYETVDVLADERMRAEIKRFSQWPTIPQLYIQGEFVGGSDILLELYQSGELQEMLEIAAAS